MSFRWRRRRRCRAPLCLWHKRTLSNRRQHFPSFNFGTSFVPIQKLTNAISRRFICIELYVFSLAFRWSVLERYALDGPGFALHVFVRSTIRYFCESVPNIHQLHVTTIVIFILTVTLTSVEHFQAQTPDRNVCWGEHLPNLWGPCQSLMLNTHRNGVAYRYEIERTRTPEPTLNARNEDKQEIRWGWGWGNGRARATRDILMK